MKPEEHSELLVLTRALRSAPNKANRLLDLASKAKNQTVEYRSAIEQLRNLSSNRDDLIQAAKALEDRL